MPRAGMRPHATAHSRPHKKPSTSYPGEASIRPGRKEWRVSRGAPPSISSVVYDSVRSFSRQGQRDAIQIRMGIITQP
jgi:hypothetical protein